MITTESYFCPECRSTGCLSVEHAEIYRGRIKAALAEVTERIEWLKSDRPMVQPLWCQFCGVRLVEGNCPSKELRHPNQ